MRATFFCIGRRAAAHPALVREIVRRGHTVENHSERHGNAFAVLSAPRPAAPSSPARRQASPTITGRAPRFFRAPMGLRSPLPRSRAAPARPASGELDPPRLRRGAPRPGPRAPPPHRPAGGGRHPGPARRQCRPDPRKGSPSPSPCCPISCPAWPKPACAPCRYPIPRHDRRASRSGSRRSKPSISRTCIQVSSRLSRP